MEDSAPHAAALAVREPGGGDDGTAGGIDGKEGNAVERGTLSCGEVDAELCEGGDGVGEEAFTAGLVDGRGHAVGDLYCEAVLGSGYGTGESSGASAGDEDIWGR